MDSKLETILLLYDLGVRQIALSYNKNNIAGGGCFDIDKGLTEFGKLLVKECNDIGMVLDCSHVGNKTSMEIIELSTKPVVFSHSNPHKLTPHPRNIIDDQIIACAEKGGVIGINGIGIFLGENNVSTEKIIDHIDYVIQKVGPEHVGLGLDCVFDKDEAQNYAIANPDIYPKKYGFENVVIAEPEQFSEISESLFRRGYNQCHIDSILGNNFFRIAKKIWT